MPGRFQGAQSPAKPAARDLHAGVRQETDSERRLELLPNAAEDANTAVTPYTTPYVVGADMHVLLFGCRIPKVSKVCSKPETAAAPQVGLGRGEH